MTNVSDAHTSTVAEERPGLAELVREIRRVTDASSDPQTTASAVADVLVASKPTTALLTEEEQAGSPDGYIRFTLHAERDFSVVGLVWRPGQATEVHDHLVW